PVVCPGSPRDPAIARAGGADLGREIRYQDVSRPGARGRRGAAAAVARQDRALARCAALAGAMDIPRAFNAATWFVDRHVAEGRASRLAVRYGGRDITYGDVRAGANRCGNALRRLGVGMEQRVVLLLPDGPEFVYAFWGALKIGAVPIPTNTLLKPRDYEYILNDSRAQVAIAGEELAPAIEAVRPRLPCLRHLVVAGRAGPGQMGLSELVTAESGELDPAATTKDDVAFWLYTSGTTGTPKAAVHLHHDMVVCCEAFGRHVLEIGPEDRCFSVARLFFAYGLGNALYFPFHVGAATVLDSRRPEPVKVFEILTRERPTLFFAVPTAFAAMLQVADAERLYDLLSVRLCLSAGEPLPKPIYERWRERFGLEILDGIGSTEMCHTFIANRRGTVCPGSSGTLVPGYEAMVVDDAGRAVAPGDIGNLLVKVESALAEHPAVVEAGVVGAADADDLVKPLAFVVLAAGHAASPALEEELKGFVKQ